MALNTRSIAMALLLSCLAATARADVVALVTDVQGRATLEGKPLAILARLEEGARIALEKDARVVALYLRAGDEYALSGPGTARPGGKL